VRALYGGVSFSAMFAFMTHKRARSHAANLNASYLSPTENNLNILYCSNKSSNFLINDFRRSLKGPIRYKLSNFHRFSSHLHNVRGCESLSQREWSETLNELERRP